MKNFLALHAIKILVGIIAAMAFALWWQTTSLDDCREAKALSDAALTFQNSAIEAERVESARRLKAARDASKAAKAETRKAEGVARKIEAPRELSGKCETPESILSAEL